MTEAAVSKSSKKTETSAQQTLRNLHTQLQKLVVGQENLLTRLLVALLADLMKAKPTSAKGVYMKKVSISTTMGPGLHIDHSTLIA